MRIEKLYTSIGFVKYLKSLTTKEFCQLSGAKEPVFIKSWTTEQNALDFMRVDAVKLRLRDDYDTLVMKPLKKEMFVIEKEHSCEKNIIFKGDWKGQEDDSLGIITYQVTNGKVLLEFFQDGAVCFVNEKYQEFEVRTLNDLAELSNCEFELNVEL